MGAYKKRIGHKYFFDMGKVKCNETFLHANACARRKHRELKRLDPFAKTIGGKRKYESPEDLKKRCDEYFNSLTREIELKNGEKVFEQVRPATLSGLAQFLGINTNTLRTYHMKSISGLIPPEFAEIVLEARQKIEVFAEEQIYSRDGSRGAQFVLQAGFGWQTKKEQSEQKLNSKRLKLMKKEFELKKQMLADAKEETDKEIKIEIIRATKKKQDDGE